MTKHVEQWLKLIVHKPQKELRRHTKWYNSKQYSDQDQEYPVHGGFTEYGNLIATRMGINR